MRRTLSSASIRFGLAMAVMCFTFVAFAALASPAHAASISGTVVDADTAVHLRDIYVVAYQWNGGSGSWDPVSAVWTDTDGRYAISGLAETTHRVGFFDYTYSLYTTEYWDGADGVATVEAAGDVDLSGVPDATGIDTALTRITGTGHGSSISGHVTGSETLWDCDGVQATIYRDDGGGGWSWYTSAQTGTDGYYLATSLPADTYIVEFTDAAHGWYEGEYYNNAPVEGSATPIVLGEDSIDAGVDAQLDLTPRTIAGTVTGEDTLAPVAGVYAYLYYEYLPGLYSYYTGYYTDVNGRFVLTGLGSYTYKLQLDDSNDFYLTEWYDNVATMDDAVTLAIGADTVVVGADAALSPAGVISGSVTAEDSGDPVTTAYVYLYRYSEATDAWEYHAGASPDPSGDYSFSNLPHGTYRALCYDTMSVYLAEYYNDAAGLLDAADLAGSATPVTGVDFVLARGGRVSGRVTVSVGGTALAGAAITPLAWDADGAYWYELSAQTAYSNGSGDFTVQGLPFGTYRFRATASGHASEFWLESATVEAADDRTFSDDTLQTGMDFTLDPYGTVSGHVSDLSGTLALSNIHVQLYRYGTEWGGAQNWIATSYSTVTNSSGNYTITGVPAGTYRARFYDQNAAPPAYLTEYSGEQPNVYAATDIFVGAGAAVVGIDAHMSAGATISGTVVDGSDAPLQSVTVRALAYNPRDDDWEPYGSSALTDGSGNYSLTALPDDVYRLSFTKGGYITQYYDGAANVFAGTGVTISNGASVGSRNAKLLAGSAPANGTITGTVTADATGFGLSGVQVIAWRSDPAERGGWYWANSTNTIGSGGYSMSAPPGVYRIQFTDSYGRCLGEYYDDATAPADATHVSVTTGATTVVNVALADAGSISGTVTAQDGGTPLASITIRVYGRSGQDTYYVGETSTDANGAYTMGGLRAGSYRVSFEDYSGLLVSEFYDARGSLPSADETPLGAGEDAVGIDASMVRFGRILGTVTGGDGRPIDGIRATLYKRYPDAWSEYNSTLTDEDGTYLFTGLRPGQYLVRFADEGTYGFTRYDAEYHSDAAKKSDATPVTISTLDVTVDETLAATGTWGDITGTVTNAVTGDPIDGLAVCRYDPDGGGGWMFSGYSDVTATDGTYTLQWVPVGSDYRICADPTYPVDGLTPWNGIYAMTYHLDAANIGDALAVAVTGGDITPDVDVHAAPEPTVGYLSGHVIEDGTGADVAGVEVAIYRDMGGYFDTIAYAYTDASGAFDRPVPEGTYALGFTHWPAHRAEFYEDIDTTSPADGTPVTVTAAASTDVTASLEPLGSIAGAVTSESSGDPLPGISVDVYFYTTSSGMTWIGGDVTDASGAYEVPGLAYGTTYRVNFNDYSGDYVDEVYANKHDIYRGDNVIVGAVPTTGIDAALADAAKISGVVTDAVTHAPVQNVYVAPYYFDEASYAWSSGDGAYTDENGLYIIGGLSGGAYRLGAFDWYDDYADEYYDEVRTLVDATDVPVAPGELAAGIDMALEKQGTISGTVTDVGTGNPIAYAWVYAYRYRAATDDWQNIGSDQADVSGAYTLSNLAPGVYRLQFSAGGYVSEYRHNEYEVWAGGDVTVAADEDVTGINEALSHGATISGTVRNGAGTGIQGALAVALRYDPRTGRWKGITSSYTDSSGAYTLYSLGDYAYKVMVWDPYGRYMTEYFNNAATPEAGQTVTIAGEVAIANVNLVLDPYAAPAQGTIAGTVLADDDGAPVGGVNVTAMRYQTQYGNWASAGVTATAANGTYALMIGEGTYRIFFDDTSGGYLDEYHHNGGIDVWDGADITVTAAATTMVDEGLATASHIRGTVTAEADGTPLGGIAVNAYEMRVDSGWVYAGTAMTDAAGAYDIAGLNAATYRVGFEDPTDTYLDEYYDDTPEIGWATNLALGASSVLDGIDASLATAGTIAGTVTNEANGRGIENLRVTLWRDDGAGPYEWSTTWTDDLGGYRFGNLFDATYYVQFRDTDNPYGGWPRFVDEWHLDASDVDTATAVPVANDAHTVDAELTSNGTWGSISGTVADGPTGQPLADMPVWVYYDPGSGWTPYPGLSTMTATNGTYEFPYVPEQVGQAPYRVGAQADISAPWSPFYDATFHLDAASVDSAADVPLVGHAYLTGVDVEMARKPGVAWIGGTVKRDVTNEVLSGISVDIYDAGTGDGVGSATTSADGTYGLPVPAGTYEVRFRDDTGAYAQEWYDNRTWQSDADGVLVGSGESVAANAWLAPAAHITGSVRDSAGNPLETWVYLYDTDWNYVTDTYSSAGDYAFDGLWADTYWVWFSSNGPYMGEYWNDRTNYGDDIVLASGETSSSIDATLSAGGTISGTVTSDDGGLAANAYIGVYDEEPLGWEWVTGFYAYDYDGWSFESGALRPGDYKLQYWDTWGVYDQIFYDGATTLDSGALVTVTENEPTPVTLRLDGLPPAVFSDAVSDYDDVASIEVTATDLVTGVASVSYRFGGFPAVETPGDQATFVSPAGALGAYQFEYWATDALGHESGHESLTISIHDATPPTVSSNAQASYPTTATITITAADPDGSGIDYICYVVDSDEDTQTVYAGSAEVEVGGVGDHSLEYWAVDNEGNESAHETDEFTIQDVTDPTADDDAVASYVGSASINISADDNVAVDYISYSLNDGAWVDDPGDLATVTVATVGTHKLEYQAFDTSGNSSPVYTVYFTVTRSNGVTQTQIAGTNRYSTSVEISKVAFPTGADWVVIATGNNWPDALGGSALAGALDGPILLTDTNMLPAAISAEITRLGADKAIILGGTAAVGTPVENALKALLGAGDVERLAGTNRYQTADMVGARTIDILGGTYDGTAFVATGANYPDALGAAPLSAGLGWPLFLTKPTGLDAATVVAMTGVDHVLILGGNAVVSPAIEASLDARYGGTNVDRLAGANRYDTAVVVATYGVAHGLAWNHVAIATGEAFPDALAGGVLQGRTGSVMLLTPSTSLNASVDASLRLHKSLIAEVRYLGGLNAVTQSVRNAVALALQ